MHDGAPMRSVHRVVVITLAVVPLSAACGNDHDDCSPTAVSKRLEVEVPADPALQLRVDSCRVDADACPALCELALQRVNVGSFGVNSCRVGFAGDVVLMDVDYTQQDPNCFFGGDDFAQPAPVGGGL